MGYSVTGDYLEACSCDVSCPCIFLGPATREACDVFFAWHIDQGEKDGTDLSGLNVALAVNSPKVMTEGNWTAALYVDDRADPAQREALAAIFSGQAGGHLANVAPLIGTVTGIADASITFERLDGGGRRVSVGEVLSMAVDQLVGMDGSNPIVISNPLLGAITQPLRQARSSQIRYADSWQFAAEGTNGFVAEFAYAS